jgi:hypothetical protein
MSVEPSLARTPRLRTVAWQPLTAALPVPTGIQIDSAAWLTLMSTRVDALLMGDAVIVLRVLTAMWPALQKPVFWSECGRLLLPQGRDGTVILRGIHELDGGDQQRLLGWLDDLTHPPRLVSTGSLELLSLVEEGAIARRLYDRLRGVELVITAGHPFIDVTASASAPSPR